MGVEFGLSRNLLDEILVPFARLHFMEKRLAELGVPPIQTHNARITVSVTYLSDYLRILEYCSQLDVK